jgi:hypothetical protein
MKKMYLLVSFLMIALSPFAKSYYVYTANNSGNYEDKDIWSVAPRTDKEQKDKIIIPYSFTITFSGKSSNISNDVEIVVYGSLKLGSSTELKLTDKSSIGIMGNGSIVGNGYSQQIYIGKVIKYAGNKNKTLSGLLYADNTTGVAPTGFASYTLLPLQFLSFMATENKDKSVTLAWSTIHENRDIHFEVQKSLNGLDWSHLAVYSASEKQNSISYYTFNDNSKTGEFTSYRVKQVSADGVFKYSPVKMIQKTEKNPSAIISFTDKSIHVQFEQKMLSEVHINLMNSSGKVVSSQSYSKPNSHLTFPLNALNHGIYIVQLTDNSGWKQARKILLN